jgi:hypothetical protein
MKVSLYIFDRTGNYDEELSAAKTICLRKMEIVCFYIGLPIADRIDCQWLAERKEIVAPSESVNSQLHDLIKKSLSRIAHA